MTKTYYALRDKTTGELSPISEWTTLEDLDGPLLHSNTLVSHQELLELCGEPENYEVVAVTLTIGEVVGPL